MQSSWTFLRIKISALQTNANSLQSKYEEAQNELAESNENGESPGNWKTIDSSTSIRARSNSKTKRSTTSRLRHSSRNSRVKLNLRSSRSRSNCCSRNSLGVQFPEELLNLTQHLKWIYQKPAKHFKIRTSWSVKCLPNSKNSRRCWMTRMIKLKS